MPASQPINSFSAPLFDFKQYTPVITLTIGPDFINKGPAQTLTILPPFQKHYTVNGSGYTETDGGGFIGLERVITERLSVQFGVAGYGDTGFNSSGDVWQFAQPQFANVAYTYKVHHSRVMFANKLLTTVPQYKAIHPYFSWEIGAAFNRATGYQEAPKIAQAFTMTPYANHSSSSFAWGVGVGFDYALNQNIRAGIGYQFSDLGSVSLGRSVAVTTNQTLTIPNLYTNQLRFQLTYLL